MAWRRGGEAAFVIELLLVLILIALVFGGGAVLGLLRGAFIVFCVIVGIVALFALLILAG